LCDLAMLAAFGNAANRIHFCARLNVKSSCKAKQ